MARTYVVIHTVKGPEHVSAYPAGEIFRAHRTVSGTGTWTVTHRRTGLALTTQHPTRDDAVACGMGASLIVRHYGDRGTWGDGSTVTAPGPLRDALMRYTRSVRGRPDSYVDGRGMLRDVNLTTPDALRYAREAIRYTDDAGWIRDNVAQYGHEGSR